MPDPPVYRIADWNEHYENNRTRAMRTMAWVPLPVKLAGDGYTELVAGKNGAAIYGAWIACVLAAASCSPRGTLMRGNGKPHTCETLERITRIPAKHIGEMLLRAQVVGWIEVAGGCRESAGATAPGRQEGAGKVPSLESEGIREKQTVRQPGTEPPGFLQVWSAYPHHPNRRRKADALRVWKRLGLESNTDSVLAWIAALAAGEEWRRDGGQYVTACHRFLAGTDFSETPPSASESGADDWRTHDDSCECAACLEAMKRAAESSA